MKQNIIYGEKFIVCMGSKEHCGNWLKLNEFSYQFDDKSGYSNYTNTNGTTVKIKWC